MEKRRSTYSNDSTVSNINHCLDGNGWWFNRYPRAINFKLTSIDHVNDVANCRRAIATDAKRNEKENQDEHDEDDVKCEVVAVVCSLVDMH